MESRIGPIKEYTGLVSLIDYGQLVEMTLEDRDNFADFIIAVDGKPPCHFKAQCLVLSASLWAVSQRCVVMRCNTAAANAVLT